MTFTLGDYFCQRGAGLFGIAIRFVTRSPVNHAGIGTDILNNKVVEALSPRVVLSNAPTDGIWSTDAIRCTPEQRTEAARHAEGMVGVSYGWLDVVALGALQYGIRLPYLIRRLQDKKHLFCSQLVDEAYRLAGVQLFNDGRLPQDVTPGDLYNLIMEGRKS